MTKGHAQARFTVKHGNTRGIVALCNECKWKLKGKGFHVYFEEVVDADCDSCYGRLAQFIKDPTAKPTHVPVIR